MTNTLRQIATFNDTTTTKLSLQNNVLDVANTVLHTSAVHPQSLGFVKFSVAVMAFKALYTQNCS